MANTYIIIGGKWRDKVYGNTYNSAKIIEAATGKTYYTRFCYGYGSAYMQEARQYIKEELQQENPIIIDGGSFYIKKAEAKNGQF